MEGIKFVRQGLDFNWHDIGMTLLFQNGFHSATPISNGPLWSLSIEIWYYLIAAISVFLYERKLS